MSKEKGITLIALIITIIVMLILVGVTINVALNGGLFEKAKDAKEKTVAATEKEQLMLAALAAFNPNTGVDYEDINLPEGLREVSRDETKIVYEGISSGKQYEVIIETGNVNEVPKNEDDDNEEDNNQTTNPVVGTYYCPLEGALDTVTFNEDGTLTAPQDSGTAPFNNATYTYSNGEVVLTLGTQLQVLEFCELTGNKILKPEEGFDIFFAMNRNGLEGEEISGTYVHASDKLIIDSETGTWLNLAGGTEEKGKGYYFYYNNVIYGFSGTVNEDGTISSAGTVWTK